MTTDLQARLRECICELHEGVEKGWRIAEPQHFERRFIEAADELSRLTAMVERLGRDRVKLDNLRHNHAALLKEHDEWKGAVENSVALQTKADALAEAVGNLYKPGIAGPWKRLQAALTDYQGDGK